MSNKTSKERTNSNDYHNGDEICKKCIGITYFSANLREKKYSPVCFGWRKNVEDLTKRKQLEDIHTQALRNQEYDDSKDFAYVCNGISETTGKLDRQGAIPNCYGIKILFIEDEKKRRQKNTTSNDREISLNDPNKIPDPVSRKLDEEITKKFKETFEEYTNLTKLRVRMTRGVKRQWKWMGKTYDRIFTNLPARFYRSTNKLLYSSANNLGICSNIASQWWNDIFRKP